MLKFHRTVFLSCALIVMFAPVWAEVYGLGRLATTEEIAAWDWEVMPDGAGLPIGSGDAIDGEEVFAEKCASCHGDFAEGMGRWPELAGGIDTLDEEDPLKTVGSYWPYMSTVIDYIKRSMPFGYAGSLTNDETYAIVAYILYSNDLIEDDFILSNENALEIKMPNAEGFIIDDREEKEYSRWRRDPCMINCKDAVQITMRARVLDVTPEDEKADGPSQISEPVTVQENAVVKIASINRELADSGKKVFKKCKSCHQIGESAKNRSGPILNNMVGYPAASVKGYKYSKAFRSAKEGGLVWTEEELSKFLTKPKKYLKGTKMSFAGLKKAKDTSAIIEYLKLYSE